MPDEHTKVRKVDQAGVVTCTLTPVCHGVQTNIQQCFYMQIQYHYSEDLSSSDAYDDASQGFIEINVDGQKVRMPSYTAGFTSTKGKAVFVDGMYVGEV